MSQFYDDTQNSVDIFCNQSMSCIHWVKRKTAMQKHDEEPQRKRKQWKQAGE